MEDLKNLLKSQSTIRLLIAIRLQLFDEIYNSFISNDRIINRSHYLNFAAYTHYNDLILDLCSLFVSNNEYSFALLNSPNNRILFEENAINKISSILKSCSKNIKKIREYRNTNIAHYVLETPGNFQLNLNLVPEIRELSKHADSILQLAGNGLWVDKTSYTTYVPNPYIDSLKSYVRAEVEHFQEMQKAEEALRNQNTPNNFLP